MRVEQPYNPLDKTNLGVSVADALLARAPVSFPVEPFIGAGIYAIYYLGDFEPYAPIAEQNRSGALLQPIYVGKAIPSGARIGGTGTSGPSLHKRLTEHAESIRATANLKLEDFVCRYLVVDDIWIPLGESLMIGMLKPVWNHPLAGFGNHAPGSGRYKQKRSRWDVVHPGRSWADGLQPNEKSLSELYELIRDHLAHPELDTDEFPVIGNPNEDGQVSEDIDI